MKDIGIYNYGILIPVMLPGSAIREKVLTQSLFIDARTHRKIRHAVFCVNIKEGIKRRKKKKS